LSSTARFQGRKSTDLATLKKIAKSSIVTPGTTCPATQRHIAEDWIINYTAVKTSKLYSRTSLHVVTLNDTEYGADTFGEAQYKYSNDTGMAGPIV
jgi:hypothetical protein